jgi:hypothetical protein
MIVLVLLLLAVQPAHAQWAGDHGRVRVTTASGRVAGYAVQLTPDTLVLARTFGRTVHVPVRRILRVEVSRGRDHLAGAVRGMAVGAVAAGAVGAVLLGAANGGCEGGDVCLSRTQTATFGFLGGVVLGGGAGLVLGAAAGSDRWVPGALPTRAVSLSVRVPSP